MRKILPLILATLMLIFALALTSCDVIADGLSEDLENIEEIAALGHNAKWITTTEPTCTTSGTKVSECLSCKIILETKTIAPLGHEYVHHDAQMPTCTSIGWNEYETCSRCNYTTYEEIEAVGHGYIHHDAKIPTCTDFGWNAYETCSRCDYTNYEKIEALGHEYVDYACIRCGLPIQIAEIKEIPAITVPLNTSYEGLGLPGTAAVTASNGAIYYLPVTWDEYEYDHSVAGSHTISGQITLEDGFMFADGVSDRVEINFELSEKMHAIVDIVFLVDTTGSMSEEIKNVSNNISGFAKALADAGISARWALIEYRDITCDGLDSTKVINYGTSEWYIDVASYEKALEGLNANNGADSKGTVIDALKAATHLDSRAGAKTFYFVVTDADYKTDNQYGVSGMNEMINELATKEIVTSVVTKTDYYDIYRELTSGTYGILADIDGNLADELLRLAGLVKLELKLS